MHLLNVNVIAERLSFTVRKLCFRNQIVKLSVHLLWMFRQNVIVPFTLSQQNKHCRDIQQHDTI